MSAERIQITSTKNPRVQQVVRLRRSRERKKTELFVIDGLREIALAQKAGISFVEIYMRGQADLPAATADWVATHQEVTDGQWFEVSGPVFEKLSYGDRDDGIVVVASQRKYELEAVVVSEMTALVLIAEGLEKPGNLGAILRTADATGVDTILLVDAEVDLYNPNVIRTSMGAAFTIPVVHATPDEAKQWCQTHEIELLATRVDGEKLYHHADMRKSVAIVLGNEARGLTAAWHDPSVTPVRLTMRGAVDSLNVSVAAGVLLYEVRRQRDM